MRFVVALQCLLVAALVALAQGSSSTNLRQLQVTAEPTESPTFSPTKNPTTSPTDAPTLAPTASPTLNPTTSPTLSPTNNPTTSPTNSPTAFVQQKADELILILLGGLGGALVVGCFGALLFITSTRGGSVQRKRRTKASNRNESEFPTEDDYEDKRKYLNSDSPFNSDSGRFNPNEVAAGDYEEPQIRLPEVSKSRFRPASVFEMIGSRPLSFNPFSRSKQAANSSNKMLFDPPTSSDFKSSQMAKPAPPVKPTPPPGLLPQKEKPPPGVLPPTPKASAPANIPTNVPKFEEEEIEAPTKSQEIAKPESPTRGPPQPPMVKPTPPQMPIQPQPPKTTAVKPSPAMLKPKEPEILSPTPTAPNPTPLIIEVIPTPPKTEVKPTPPTTEVKPTPAMTAVKPTPPSPAMLKPTFPKMLSPKPSAPIPPSPDFLKPSAATSPPKPKESSQTIPSPKPKFPGSAVMPSTNTKGPTNSNPFGSTFSNPTFTPGSSRSPKISNVSNLSEDDISFLSPSTSQMAKSVATNAESKASGKSRRKKKRKPKSFEMGSSAKVEELALPLPPPPPPEEEEEIYMPKPKQPSPAAVPSPSVGVPPMPRPQASAVPSPSVGVPPMPRPGDRKKKKKRKKVNAEMPVPPSPSLKLTSKDFSATAKRRNESEIDDLLAGETQQSKYLNEARQSEASIFRPSENYIQERTKSTTPKPVSIPNPTASSRVVPISPPPLVSSTSRRKKRKQKKDKDVVQLDDDDF